MTCQSWGKRGSVTWRRGRSSPSGSVTSVRSFRARVCCFGSSSRFGPNTVYALLHWRRGGAEGCGGTCRQAFGLGRAARGGVDTHRLPCQRRSHFAHSRGVLKASIISASGEPAAGSCEYSHRAVSGSDMRIDSMRPPVLRPKTVPSHGVCACVSESGSRGARGKGRVVPRS